MVIHKIIDFLRRGRRRRVRTGYFFIRPPGIFKSDEILALGFILRLVGVNDSSIQPTFSCTQIALDKMSWDYKAR